MSASTSPGGPPRPEGPAGARRAVDLAAAFTAFDEHWSPRIVAEVNDYDVKIAKVEGAYAEHAHADTDEFFLVISGRLRLEFRERDAVELRPGQLHVVPKGVHHRPLADPGTQILMFEPRGTLNSGDADVAGTAGVVLE
jgi:mannose-6-phosphate isomerase-like protein (cupin superfamily)